MRSLLFCRRLAQSKDWKPARKIQVTQYEKDQIAAILFNELVKLKNGRNVSLAECQKIADDIEIGKEPVKISTKAKET